MERVSLRYLAVALAFLMWGTNGVFVRNIDASPLTFMFANAVLGLAALVPLLFLTGRFRELAQPRNIGLTVSFGFLATVTGLLFYKALQLTTITNALLSHYTMPVFVILLAPLFLSERRKWSVALACPVALAGLALILPFDNLSFGNTHVLGIGVGVVSALFYASSMIGIRRLGGSFSALTIAVAAFAATTISTGPFVLLQQAELQSLIEFGPMLAFKGVFTAAVPWFFYTSSLKVIEAQRVSIIGFLEPLTNIFLAALFLSEVPGPLTLVGGLLILGAGYWVMRHGAEPAKALAEEGQAF